MKRKTVLIILALLVFLVGGYALGQTQGKWATHSIVWLPPLGPTGEVNFITGLQNVDTDLYNYGSSITTLQAQIAQFVLTAGQTYTLPSTSETLMAADFSNASDPGNHATYVMTSNGSGSAPAFQPTTSALTYPGAGVPLSTGSTWGTSYTVGTGAYDLVQLGSAAQLPALNGANLTSLPATDFLTMTQPSRSLGSVYHNTSAKPMMVTVTGTNTANTTYAYLGATSSPATVVAQIGNGAQGFCITFVVPPAYYYEVASSSGSIVAWTEWN